MAETIINVCPRCSDPIGLGELYCGRCGLPIPEELKISPEPIPVLERGITWSSLFFVGNLVSVFLFVIMGAAAPDLRMKSMFAIVAVVNLIAVVLHFIRKISRPSESSRRPRLRSTAVGPGKLVAVL